MRSLKVLILEPDPYQLMALHQMLNAVGIYDVLTASSLASARRSLARRAMIDIAICDPQHSGGEGIALIRQLAERQEAHAVILLGRAPPGLLSDLEAMLQAHDLQLLGRLYTPVSAVLMRAMLDGYLMKARHPSRA
ncbi:Response regulator receiver domain-containing protein [Pseudomonas helmanticensis]|uniref:Response regulator receiver domain-containing protein n=1 Tax=Pseudomonas helmanticensis TaxID=1471381 RepID=A0ACD2U6T0_9PSED|nr:response regulator [Pseudomonas helmanticensis]SMQ26384.1 Response regulator receiver domain-containing protein [Pseudomonas helmanticensis]